jgi:hypothetical protein
MADNSTLRLIHLGVPQGFIGGAAGYIFASALQAKGHIPGGELWALVAAAMLGSIAWGINYLLMRGGDRLGNSVYAPSGDTTAYVPTFSHIEALEARGDLDGAERAWEEACAEHPQNAFVLVKAADFHLRLRSDPAAAVARVRKVRELPSAPPDLVRYASQKLIDLHLGPLADEGRALVELRRMIDRFPGTREAADAREVLARLKQNRSGA